MISRIPAICLRTVTGHVAVCIIANRASAPLGKLVIRIIGCRADGLGHTCAGKAAADAAASAGGIVRVAEVPERVCAGLIGDSGQLRSGVVGVVGCNAVWQRERQTPASRVVAESYIRTTLHHLKHTIRIVISIGDGRLAGDSHRVAPSRSVVSIGYRSLRRHLRCKPVQTIVVASHRSRNGIHDLRQTVHGIISIGHRAFICRTGLCPITGERKPV